MEPSLSDSDRKRTDGQTKSNGRTELIQRCLYDTVDIESESRENRDLVGDQIKNDNDKFIYNTRTRSKSQSHTSLLIDEVESKQSKTKQNNPYSNRTRKKILNAIQMHV